jgi:hypothetical protein
MGALQKIGFKAVPHEPCCLTCDDIVVFFYVDDIVFAFPKRKTAHAQEMIELLKARYHLSGGADLQWFLGIEVVRDRSRRLIWLSQASYIDKIAARASRRTRKDTPIGMEELQPRLDLASLREIHDFQVKTGSILYAAVITRPDVAFAASRIIRHNANPSQKHYDAADCILNYLQATRDYALQLGGADDFEVSSDASFADNQDRKSSQAYAMKLFGGLIAWRANKQDTVTTSTTEAELLALSQAAKESLFVSRLLQELDIQLEDARIRIQCDNQQTIRLVTSEIASLQTRLRHVDIHNHWLRQEVQANRISVTYTPSDEMIADGLTKALQGDKFRRFRSQLGLVDLSDHLGQRQLAETQLDDHIRTICEAIAAEYPGEED